ncbi:MAG: hypothetical protein BIFFINMI_03328 [Phycisphaerae bacterium]|nr:hypothetical protein [Phycisphaerae bacterium]
MPDSPENTPPCRTVGRLMAVAIVSGLLVLAATPLFAQTSAPTDTQPAATQPANSAARPPAGQPGAIERALYPIMFTWLIASVLLLTSWGIQRRGGLDDLAQSPARPNYLQFPTVLFIMLVFLLLPDVVIMALMKLGLIRDDSASSLLWAMLGRMAGILMLLPLIVAVASAAFADRTRGFGLRWKSAGRDMQFGIVCLAVILPIIQVTNVATDRFFKHMGWSTPEHPLFQTLTPAHPALMTLGLAMAAIAAPIAEEMLFRGVLQSFMVRFFTQMMPPKGWPSMALSLYPPELKQLQAKAAVARARAMGEQPPADLDAPPDPATMGGQAGPLTPRQRSRRSAAAIVVTALLFASVHMGVPESMPAIFLLALMLGYAYEKTGSLLTPIAAHFAFNAVNLAIYMLSH